MGIIQELQKDLLNNQIKLSDILIKAKIPATKLNLLEFKNWLDEEIQGYEATDLHPQYRHIKGICRYWDTFSGWQNMKFHSSQAESDLSHVLYSKSVFEIEDLLMTTPYMEYQTPISPALIQQYNLNRLYNVVIFIQRRSLSNILNGVRGKLMEYITKLDDVGIEGNNSNFTKDEKDKAQTIINQTINMSGGNFMNQVTSGNPTQTVNNGLDIQQIQEVCNLILANINKFGLEQAKILLLEAELQNLNTQINNKPQNYSLIQQSLQSMRNIMEGAIGSALGQGILHTLKLLGC